MNGARRPLRCIVIGAGMAGILAAIRLAEAGCTDLTVYEKADGVGGTWRDNTYPGLSCDVPSHLYSYSFALNPEWSHEYAPGPEIRSYLEAVAADHGVMDRIRFGEEVTRCSFIDGRWHLDTAAGRHDRADVVIAATGVLHRPRHPQLAGLDTFAGSAFHSARWDHDVPIDGRRLGVIGTGSSAVQIVSSVVDRVEALTLFQRTAQWIMPLDNPAVTEDERDGLRQHPDRLAERYRGLSDLYDVFSHAVVDAESPGIRMIERACLANLEDNVHDPELRERLRPSYRAACKRLVISPDFYGAIQRPHARLVTEGIAGVEPGGVRTVDGELHPLDVLVMATGFEADAFMRPMAVTGRHGRTLDTAWSGRPEAYLSVSVPGFPNFFMLNGPNGPIGNFSLIEVAELQMGYILHLVDGLAQGDFREASATEAALVAFEAQREAAAAKTVWVTGCTSWYLDDRGIPGGWPWSFIRFREAMRAPDLSHFELV